MRFNTHLPLALAISFVALGCGSDSPGGGGGIKPNTDECHDANKPGCVVASSEKRSLTPAVPEADLNELVAGNTTFALSLYQEIRKEPGNLFYSPYSISSALAMTIAGARGETESQMAGALSFTLPQDRLHPAFNALDLALTSRGQGADSQDGEGFRLNIANALWGQSGYPYEQPFLDVLGVNYGAGMRIVDFMKAPEEARGIINGWVAERTEDKVKDLLPSGSITPDTRLVLTNAIYFNAAWDAPFEEEATAPGTFTARDGSAKTVDMMSANLPLEYGEGEGFTALDLPYDGNELSMVLVLPSDIEEFEGKLAKARIDEVVSSLGSRSVSVLLPKFKFESDLDLKKPLSNLGMSIAFSGDADFSGINGTGGLAITDVLHKAFVSVNEAGTEAAAATAVIIGETSAPEPATIHFDKPFLFFIRDIATGAVLFIGRVDDPSI